MYQCTLSKTVHLHSKRSSITAFLFWRFEYCLRLTVKPSMEKHIALHSQLLCQSSTRHGLSEAWCSWMQSCLAQQWPIWWLIPSPEMLCQSASQTLLAFYQSCNHVCLHSWSSATATKLSRCRWQRKSQPPEKSLRVGNTARHIPKSICILIWRRLVSASRISDLGLKSLQSSRLVLSEPAFCTANCRALCLFLSDTLEPKTGRPFQPASPRASCAEISWGIVPALACSWRSVSYTEHSLRPVKQWTSEQVLGMGILCEFVASSSLHSAVLCLPCCQSEYISTGDTIGRKY